MMKNRELILLFIGLTLFCVLPINAQKRNSDVYKHPEMSHVYQREIIRIPDLKGYVTLKCDFHTHTIFSDGKVWPTVRVDEAWNDGLDAIAITDHIEYRPNQKVVVADLNKSNEIAVKQGEDIDMIVIKGTEITRKKPIGHLNALFIQDVNKMKLDDPVAAIDEAIRQGAFIMWNHPGWPNDTSTMYNIHKELIEKKKINGVEIFGNNFDLYPKVIEWCKKTGLTVMGNSDIHYTVANTYGLEKMARPMTLVFAKERTARGIKEALFAGRTLVYFFKNLAGREDLMTELVANSISVKKLSNKKNMFEITNNSDIEYHITYGDRLGILLPNKILRITLPTDRKVKFTNCFVGENQNLILKL
nr:PHP domain-containing protein [uncultured Bacteroides sp.]